MEGEMPVRAEQRRNAKRGTRGRGNHRGRHTRSDMGRAQWSRNAVDKRARNEEAQQNIKRHKGDNGGEDLPIYATHFSKEELENEKKKPKRKVAVLIGYSGSGYKGMQLNQRERTIEGDLFSAFVKAGAISKANSDDPKKSSLVRCARTDKGVHAAGNLMSLKLIIEEEDIVKKINHHLSPQIRVFEIVRTNGSFNAYQFCESRIYEYLIPTHAFLPPHPSSFLGKKLLKLAQEANDVQNFNRRQEDISSFWDHVEEHHIKPILEKVDPVIRPLVTKAVYDLDAEVAEDKLGGAIYQGDPEEDIACGPHVESNEEAGQWEQIIEEEKNTVAQADSSINLNELVQDDDPHVSERVESAGIMNDFVHDSVGSRRFCSNTEVRIEAKQDIVEVEPEVQHNKGSPLDLIIKQLKAAYISAKKSYRINPARLERVRSALNSFTGTHNFHNYTVHKSYHDPSAQRVIKSFVVHDEPLIIDNTEWLSLKVHGQSFMMHQIRKMVSMAALVVRCGCPEGRLQESLTEERISIPKAPGLGLLLERPVFDTYNQRLVEHYKRESIDFGRFAKEMEEFKQREIYQRIFREEARDNVFHSFFSSIDNLKSSQLLFLSSVGIPATQRLTASDMARPRRSTAVVEGSSAEDEDEDEDVDVNDD